MMEMEYREEDVDSVIDENSEFEQHWENDIKSLNTPIQLTESNSSGIVLEENDFRSEKHGNKLSELEQQVEVAEARCGTLQQQLEFMRLLYKNKFDEYSEQETYSDSEGPLKSPLGYEFSIENALLSENRSKDFITTSDQEKSPSLLSDVSGLFLSAQQNFVENISIENSPISSEFENQGQYIIDIDNLEKNFDLENNQSVENIIQFENVSGENIVNEIEVNDLHEQNSLDDQFLEQEEILLLENNCDLKNNYNVDHSYENKINCEVNDYYKNKNKITINYELDDYRGNETNCDTVTNLNYDISFKNCNNTQNYEEQDISSEKTLITEELISYISNDEKFLDSESYDLSENLQMTKIEEYIPSCSVTSEENKLSCLAMNTSNANTCKNVERNDECEADIHQMSSSHHSNNKMNEYEISASKEAKYNSGKINPSKVIKGILNGLNSTVNIISQLGENSSECGRKRHKRHSKRVSNIESRLSINTRTSIPSSESDRGHKQGSNHKLTENSLKTRKSCHSARSKYKEKSTSDAITMDTMSNQLKDNLLGTEQFLLSERDQLSYNCANTNNNHHHHHHHRRRHHHSGEDVLLKHNTTAQEEQSIFAGIEKKEKRRLRDIADTYSLKPRSRRHKSERSFERLNSKSDESLITFSVVKKSHKKTRSRRKYNEMEENDRNDLKNRKSSSNIRENCRQFKHGDYDNISITTTTRKRPKKHQESEFIEADNPECIEKCIHSEDINSTILHQSQFGTIEAKQKEEKMSNGNKGFSQHKSKCVEKLSKADKNEKAKQISTVQSENLPDHSCMGPITNMKCVNEPYCCEVSTHYDTTPNFAIPTLSSRLKQNEKPILQFLNFRNIPFVVGTSTSRSHNLALNLQQALSIMKLRNLPTVPGDLTTEVGSSLLSHQSRPSSGSSVGHKEFCPVAMAQLKSVRNQLNENNENVVQDEKNEMNRSPEVDPLPGTFESLLKTQRETENVGGICFPQLKQKGNVWDVDQTDEGSLNSKLRCTCFPTRPCIDYQKLLCEYISAGEETTFLHMLLKSQEKREIHQRTRSGISELENGNNYVSTPKEVTEFGDENGENPVYGQIQAHSKGLKDVLLNMHRDFLRLNNKYEQLQAEVVHVNDSGSDASKELAKLEAELGAKEDDIMVVMGFYKELMSLKQQVKALRARASSQTVTSKSQLALSRVPTVSVRLTRLLRTIQKFQDKLLQD